MIYPFDFSRIDFEPLRTGASALVDGGPNAIATVHAYRGRPSHDQAVALFTAAPAMLAALQCVQIEMQDDTPDWFASTLTLVIDTIAFATREVSRG